MSLWSSNCRLGAAVKVEMSSRRRPDQGRNCRGGNELSRLERTLTHMYIYIYTHTYVHIYNSRRIHETLNILETIPLWNGQANWFRYPPTSHFFHPNLKTCEHEFWSCGALCSSTEVSTVSDGVANIAKLDPDAV